MHDFTQFVISGVLLGGTYALMSVGLALIFGVMRVVNFGQADFMMLAMYATFTLWTVGRVEPLVSLLVVAPSFYGLGWLIHRALLDRLTGARYAHDAQIILTLGIGLLLQTAALLIWGANPRIVNTSYSAISWTVAGFFVDAARAYAFLVALLAGTVLFWLLRWTTLGRVLRASADDWEASEYVGIDVRHAQGVAFGLGIALTAMAGAVLTTFRPFDPFIGQQLVVLMFVAVVLGGLGSVTGALVGGLLVGLTEVLSQFFLSPSLSPVAVFGLFLAVLYLRPQGLFGHRGRTL
ncbi:MAG TPA: branched-chain amino acid ABC transporter permease [Chloroflexi bacterium]|jgi:branched-chain amino acid transport system permease protein|nr:branched-chain amino acid ABC transporter permease [Chloroflexota bacterium]HAL26623.1 branched-chain amino acid ABC transporter permease [Chloroflexota bacterium]